MGCACTRKTIKLHYNPSLVINKTKSEKSLSKTKPSIKKKHTVYFSKITQGCAFLIFDYLNFKDLYECGKCCSTFKLMSSNPELLKKFFMNLKVTSNKKIYQQDEYDLLSYNKKQNINMKLLQTFGIKHKATDYINSIYSPNIEKSLIYESSTSASNEGTPRFTHMLY